MTMEAMATMDPSEPNRPKRERDPVWLVPYAAHFGAPEWLWQAMVDSLSPDELLRLTTRPEELKAALIETWRTIRRRRVAEEWTP
jgi:hypothetical protein